MKAKRMSRRQFIKSSSYSLGAFSIGSQFFAAGHSGNTRRRPNIIFLLTDDQRWDTMGCMGNEIIQTPNLDDMAENGVLFKNAFITSSICCASRASIFAGQYACRHGINDFATDFSESALRQTYPMLLRQAGYRTGLVGKYGVGKNLPADRFDVWRGIGGQPVYEQKDENGNYKHLTQIMGEQSTDFLRSCSNDQPFCLSVSFKAPHVQDGDPRQFIYDPVYKDLYKDAVIPVPKTAAPRYFESFPEFFKNDNEARKRWEIRFSTPEDYQESVKGYYRLVTGVDVVVGRIRDELERLNFEDNTVIMFLGDNGFYLGEHGLAGKWYAHEESIRVPLVVYDPRLPADKRGQKLEEMSLNIDIAPTILSLAGLEIPDAVQGCDLMKLINGETQEWRKEFFYEHWFDHQRIPKSEAVVTERFKYIRYFEQEPIYEELYDLANDPYEENNLCGDKDHAEILNSLRNHCDELRDLYSAH